MEILITSTTDLIYVARKLARCLNYDSDRISKITSDLVNSQHNPNSLYGVFLYYFAEYVTVTNLEINE